MSIPAFPAPPAMDRVQLRGHCSVFFCNVHPGRMPWTRYSAPCAARRTAMHVGIDLVQALSGDASCLRRLRTAPVRLLFDMGGKLWIPREHVVEGVFVERVEVTVVHSADAGSAGLAEE